MTSAHGGAGDDEDDSIQVRMTSQCLPLQLHSIHIFTEAPFESPSLLLSIDLYMDLSFFVYDHLLLTRMVRVS